MGLGRNKKGVAENSKRSGFLPATVSSPFHGCSRIHDAVVLGLGATMRAWRTGGTEALRTGK